MEKAHMLGLERSSHSAAAFDEVPWEDVTGAAMLVEDGDSPVFDDAPTRRFRRPPPPKKAIVRLGGGPAPRSVRAEPPILPVRPVRIEKREPGR
jgi:hypothetical protein